MGSRLNKQRNTLNTTASHRISISIFDAMSISLKNMNMNKNKIESIKFDTGPATETTASSLNGFLKFLILTGTGFAQPIMKPPEIKVNKGIITLPNKSRCLIGFKVSRPLSLAVGSPNLFANHAWANSWTAREIKKNGRNSTRIINFSFTSISNFNLWDDNLYEPVL
jgi:hypothetical protein